MFSEKQNEVDFQDNFKTNTEGTTLSKTNIHFNKKAIDEDESLGYNKIYNPISAEQTKSQEKNNFSKRKSSTISTTISQNENIPEINNNIYNSAKIVGNSKNDSSHIYFGRERLNSSPISNYFDGTDNYLKGLNPEKNDYQKSNNYLEKKTFLREHMPSVDFYQFKTMEVNDELSMIPIPSTPKLSVDITMNKNITIQPVSTPPSQKFFFNRNTGKYDFPVYYFGYYNVDSKYIIIFNILIIISVYWNAYDSYLW